MRLRTSAFFAAAALAAAAMVVPAGAKFLFWDGIHPTRVVHTIVTQEAARLLAQ